MFFSILILSILVFAGQSFKFSSLENPSTFNLCTYSDVAYAKCVYTVTTAQRLNIDLPLTCTQRNTYKECIEAVRTNTADLLILDDDHQKAARKSGLKPVIYERVNDKSLYIAVAPRDIKYVAIKTAPIVVDQSKHRAYHAAAYFNYLRGHDICRLFNHAREGDYIKIIESTAYKPNNEEILVCINGWYAQYDNYVKCNFETGLQRTVFMRSVSSTIIDDVKRKIFDKIFTIFRPPNNYLSGVDFNFFTSFHGVDDVILKNNAIAYDLQPTYRNNVTEEVFDLLHCNAKEHFHDSSILE